MQHPRLAEDGHHVGVGLDQGLQVGVLRRGIGRVAGGAERADRRVRPGLPTGRLKKGLIRGVGAGPAPLDHVNAERIQATGNPHLVAGREGDVLALRAVAERGVEEFECRHGRLEVGGGIDPLGSCLPRGCFLRARALVERGSRITPHHHASRITRHASRGSRPRPRRSRRGRRTWRERRSCTGAPGATGRRVGAPARLRTGRPPGDAPPRR